MEPSCQLRLSEHVSKDDVLTRHPVHPKGFFFERTPQRFHPAVAYNYERQLQNELEMLERDIYLNLKMKRDNEDNAPVSQENQTKPMQSHIKKSSRTVADTLRVRTLSARAPTKRREKPPRPKSAPIRQSASHDNTVLAMKSSKRQIQRSLVCIKSSLVLGYKRVPVDPMDAQRQVRRNMEFKTRITRELYHFRRVAESVTEHQSKLTDEEMIKKPLTVYRRAAHLLSEILQHLPDYEDKNSLVSSVKEIINLLIPVSDEQQFTKFLKEWCRDVKVTKSKEDRKMQSFNLKLNDVPALKDAVKESRGSKKVVREVHAARKTCKERCPGKQLPVDDIVDRVGKRLLISLTPMLKQVSELLEQQKRTAVTDSTQYLPGWNEFVNSSKNDPEFFSNLQAGIPKRNHLPIADKKTKSVGEKGVKRVSIQRQPQPVVPQEEIQAAAEQIDTLSEQVEAHQLKHIMRRIEEMEREEDAIRQRLGGIQYEDVSPSLTLSRIPQHGIQAEQDKRSVIVYPPGYEVRLHEREANVPKQAIRKTKDPRLLLKMDAEQIDEIETGQLRHSKYLQMVQHLNRTPSIPVQQVQSISDSLTLSIWKEVEQEVIDTLLDMANTVARDELWSTM